MTRWYNNLKLASVSYWYSTLTLVCEKRHHAQYVTTAHCASFCQERCLLLLQHMLGLSHVTGHHGSPKGNPQIIAESSCGFQQVHAFCPVKRSMSSSAPPSSLVNLHFSLVSVTKDQMQFLVQKQYNADAAAGNCAGGE